MATTAVYKSYPAAAAGISRASSGTSAWSNSAWTEVVPTGSISSTFYIAGVTCMYSNNASVDTSHEVEMDIGTGTAGGEVAIMTIPFVFRIDSAVGHQPVIFLPIVEPRETAGSSRISVRVRQSLATTTVTYNGIKIFYY